MPGMASGNFEKVPVYPRNDFAHLLSSLSMSFHCQPMNAFKHFTHTGGKTFEISCCLEQGVIHITFQNGFIRTFKAGEWPRSFSTHSTSWESFLGVCPLQPQQKAVWHSPCVIQNHKGFLSHVTQSGGGKATGGLREPGAGRAS